MANLLTVTTCQKLGAHGQQSPPSVPTIHVTSPLVFLDVAVLDKKGRPVVSGLTQDDFTISEDNKPQRIFSFEAPETHILGTNASDDYPDEKASVTIFVLDLLNSRFEDFAFIRYSVRNYLLSQPAQLASPAELMVIGNKSLEMVQGYTRNRADLIYAVDHLPFVLPYKEMHGVFFWERFWQSVDALQQIAVQNKGVAGRKNVVWVGHGGPDVFLTGVLIGSIANDLKEYVHDTTNMLVAARISLFVIYPGLPVQGRRMPVSAMDADVEIGNEDPFVGDINFGVFVNETGGTLFYGRNDVDAEIEQAQQIGSEYYTLTYQPANGNDNGKFRRIRVNLRNRSLHAITKAGYFAPNRNEAVDPRQQTIINIAEATRSTIPLTALDLKVSSIVRHSDTRTADLTLLIKGKNLNWQAASHGMSTATILLAAASLNGQNNILASRLRTITISANTQSATALAEVVTPVSFIVRVPRKTQSLRLVVETEESGRIGATDLDRTEIEAAPEIPTPRPQLKPRPD